MGRFHEGGSSVGLFVEDGETVRSLDLDTGEGPFYLAPNGVLWVEPSGAQVAARPRRPAGGEIRLATQSGPPLLSAGSVHPAFEHQSLNGVQRSGVGVSRRVNVVVSEGPIRSKDPAVFLRDVLGCQDALYLDGTISVLIARRHARPCRRPLGGLLVVAGRQGSAADPTIGE